MMMHPNKSIPKTDGLNTKLLHSNLPLTDIFFKSTDGTPLKGWYIEKQKGGPVVILVHGWGSCRTELYCYVPMLYKAGMNLFLFDLRNSGESKGNFSSFGHYEQLDIIGAVKYLNEREKPSSIGIIGFSMGAVSSILAMAANKKIQAGIFEAGYSNFKKIMYYQAKKRMWPLFIFFPVLIPILCSLFSWRTKSNLKNISAENAISKIKDRAVFIIHCIGDKTTPHTHADTLYNAAKEPRDIWKWEVKDGEGGHIPSWYVHPEVAEDRIVGFFRTNLNSE